MENKLQLYETKQRQSCELGLAGKYGTKKFKELNKEVQDLAIEINKENHCYYDNETWITKFNLSNDKLTGNELTDYIANELNKLNGVVLEKQIDNGKVNYSVAVITPYYVYHYKLYRGYNNIVNLESNNFGVRGNKTYTNKKVPVKHIAELQYSDWCEFKIEEHPYILPKNDTDKFELVKYEYEESTQVNPFNEII